MKIEEEIGLVLAERGLSIAVAESCTGGLVANRITDVAGASVYFEAGLVTYSNRAKERFLSIPHSLIEKHGAVSAEVAEKMAEGARQKNGVDIGLGITGIAGPGGATAAKPVGTVFIGLASPTHTMVRAFRFSGDRGEVKMQTSEEALKLVHDFLSGRLE